MRIGKTVGDGGGRHDDLLFGRLCEDCRSVGVADGKSLSRIERTYVYLYLSELQRQSYRCHMSSRRAVTVDMMTADGERPNARMRRCERAKVMTWKVCPLRVESGVACCGMITCDL